MISVCIELMICAAVVWESSRTSACLMVPADAWYCCYSYYCIEDKRYSSLRHLFWSMHSSFNSSNNNKVFHPILNIGYHPQTICKHKTTTPSPSPPNQTIHSPPPKRANHQQSESQSMKNTKCTMHDGLCSFTCLYLISYQIGRVIR